MLSNRRKNPKLQILDPRNPTPAAVHSQALRVQGLGFRAWDLGFRLQDFGFLGVGQLVHQPGPESPAT